MRLEPLSVVLSLTAAVAAQAASPALGAKPQKPRVAVGAIRAIGVEAGLAEALSEVLLARAAEDPRLDVIGRSEIAALLGYEREKQMLGCEEDSACLAEIAGALGADYLLVGSLGRIGSLLRMDLRLMDARNARVAGRYGEEVEGKLELLVPAVGRGTAQLLRPLRETAPDLATAPVLTSRRKTGLAWAGGALACFAGAAAFGLAARSAYADLEEASGTAEYDDAHDKVQARAITADVFLGAGLAASGVAAWHLLTDPPPVAVALVPRRGGAWLAVQGGF